MIAFGQFCLLAAFVATGYAAFACFMGWRGRRPWLERAGAVAGVAGAVAVTLAGAILAAALLTQGFPFRLCGPIQQPVAGLVLFVVGVLGGPGGVATALGVVGRHPGDHLSFLAAPHAEPARPAGVRHPDGLPMLLGGDDAVRGRPDATQPHGPPRRRRAQSAVAASGDAAAPARDVPRLCRLCDSFCVGRRSAVERWQGADILVCPGQAANTCPTVPTAWVREARPWTFFAWAVLGIGILVGGDWAYEELGWGGYWNWDPVENGSLIPWLAATALIHAAMVYRQRGGLKRTTLVLAGATFAACNFAAFLTRSGIFSSLHAFSQSPIGWMFVLLIAALAAAEAVLLVRRRTATAPENPISGLLAKEGVATASVFVLVLLAAAVFLGTASLPLSQVFFPHKVLVGAGFYNGVLIPTGLLLLAAMAAAPLLRWGAPPDRRQAKAILAAVVAGAIAAALAWLGGLRRPLAMAVVGLAVATAVGVAASWVLDAGGQSHTSPKRKRGNVLQVPRLRFGLASDLTVGLMASCFSLLRALHHRRRTYAGYAMHLGLACLAVGVAGSSLGTAAARGDAPQGRVHPLGRTRHPLRPPHRAPAAGETGRPSRVGGDCRRRSTVHPAAGAGILFSPESMEHGSRHPRYVEQ